MVTKRTKSAVVIKQPIKLRNKELSNGNKSLYLDIYYSGKRTYEFLNLYLIPEKDIASKRINLKTLELAETIKNKRIIELNTSIHGLSNRKENSKILLRDYLLIYSSSSKSKSTKIMVKSLIHHLIRFDQKDKTLCNINKVYIHSFSN